MTFIPTAQAAQQLDELVDAALAGDEVVLDRNGKGVRLVPVSDANTGMSKESSWIDLVQEFAGKAEGLPADMAKNHDHYLHRAPKK